MELLKSLGTNNIVEQTHSGQIVIALEGERIVCKIDFYTAFQTSIDYMLIDKAKSKRLGTIQYLPKVGDVLKFAGKRWIVESVNEDLTKKDNNIYVSQIKIGGEISFAGGCVDIDRLITEKMYQIYLSSDDIDYLDPNAKVELNFGRNFFKGNFQKDKFVSYGVENIFFTWAGTKINRTISLILNYSIGLTCQCDHLAVYNLTASNIKNAVDKGKPDVFELVTLEQRMQKERQKYDYLLSDKLLDIEYTNTYLDIESAWEVLRLSII